MLYRQKIGTHLSYTSSVPNSVATLSLLSKYTSASSLKFCASSSFSFEDEFWIKASESLNRPRACSTGMVSAWNFVISRESRKCLLTNERTLVIYLFKEMDEEREKKREMDEDGLNDWKRRERERGREEYGHTQQPPPSLGPDKPHPSYKCIPRWTDASASDHL